MSKLKLIFAGIFLSCSLIAAEPVTINFAMGTNTPNLDLTKKLLKEFEKQNPNVKVKILRLPDSADENYSFILQSLQAKSDKVDIFYIDVTWPGDLVSNLVDLNKYNGGKVLETLIPIAKKMYNVNGKLVAYPWNVEAAILYYRKDLLKKYNIQPPTTWMELTKAAYTVQQGEQAAGNKDFVGFVWQGDAYAGLACNAYEWIYSQGGGKLVNDNKQITINNKNAIAALTLATNWVGTISPKGVLSLQEESTRRAFQSGNAAFMRNWPYCYTLMQEKGSVVKDNFGISILPGSEKHKGSGVIGGWGIGINKYSKHPELAAKVAEFLVSPKSQKERALKIGAYPTAKEITNDPELTKAMPYYPTMRDAVNNGLLRPAIETSPNYNQISQAFYKAVYKVLTKEETPAVAVDNLANQIHSISKLPIKK
jgi:trehalose/maltose transport system substrate-binding protein